MSKIAMGMPQRATREFRAPSRHGLSRTPLHRSSAALRAAARLIGLYRGTGNRPVRTEHAAVPRLGPQQRPAASTVVEVDARIRRHGLTRDMSTVRTGQFGGRDQRRLRAGTGSARFAECLPSNELEVVALLCASSADRGFILEFLGSAALSVSIASGNSLSILATPFGYSTRTLRMPETLLSACST